MSKKQPNSGPTFPRPKPPPPPPGRYNIQCGKRFGKLEEAARIFQEKLDKITEEACTLALLIDENCYRNIKDNHNYIYEEHINTSDHYTLFTIRVVYTGKAFRIVLNKDGLKEYLEKEQKKLEERIEDEESRN